MALILRTKTVVQPDIKVPVRRLRFTTANNAATRAAKAQVGREEIDELLKLIAEAEYTIDEAVARNDLAHKRIEQIMREHKLSEHSNGRHMATLLEQFSRQGRTIDPKKFRAKVASDDFWKAVSVSIGEAEKILTEKEMIAITDVVPAKSQGWVLKIKKVERRVKK